MFINGMLVFATLFMFEMKKFVYLKYINPDKLIANEINMNIFDTF